MSARELSGRPLAIRLMTEAGKRAAAVTRRRGRAPRLAIVASSDAAAGSYLKIKLRACASSGVDAIVHRLSPGPRAKTLGLLADLCGDPGVDAILIETPYPRGISLADAASLIPPEKDAEGITPGVYGRFFLTKSWKETRDLVIPCTALALARLALASKVPQIGRAHV